MRQKQESKLVVKLHVPTTEPPARQDQVAYTGAFESIYKLFFKSAGEGVSHTLCLSWINMFFALVCLSLTLVSLPVKISVLRKPSDAMKEAAKMQAYGVWQPTGVLTRRRQGFPLESYVLETVYSGAGFVFEGWSKKVVYLSSSDSFGTCTLII